LSIAVGENASSGVEAGFGKVVELTEGADGQVTRTPLSEQAPPEPFLARIALFVDGLILL
jgi:hypothetical protein